MRRADALLLRLAAKSLQDGGGGSVGRGVGQRLEFASPRDVALSTAAMACDASRWPDISTALRSSAAQAPVQRESKSGCTPDAP